MVCLELLGMSRAGKTTQKECLVETLQREGSDIITLERPKTPFSEFGSVYDFHSFLIDYFDREITANKHQDLVILDRGVYDRQVLLDFDYESSAISSQQYNSLKTRLQRVIPKVDHGFVFMIPPEESLRRWKAQITQGLDYSYLNKGLDSGDDLRGLSNLHQKYLTLLNSPKLQRIEGLDSRNTNSRKIMEVIKNNGNTK